MAKLNYVELPIADLVGAKRFYSTAFGWHFTDYGSEYAAYEEGDAQLGLNGTDERVHAALPLIEVENIEAALAAVIKAGATITQEIRKFPGGQRFRFRDPEGNELGCYQNDT